MNLCLLHRAPPPRLPLECLHAASPLNPAFRMPTSLCYPSAQKWKSGCWGRGGGENKIVSLLFVFFLHNLPFIFLTLSALHPSLSPSLSHSVNLSSPSLAGEASSIDPIKLVVGGALLEKLSAKPIVKTRSFNSTLPWSDLGWRAVGESGGGLFFLLLSGSPYFPLKCIINSRHIGWTWAHKHTHTQIHTRIFKSQLPPLPIHQDQMFVCQHWNLIFSCGK